MKELWDQRFAGEEYVYGIHPNVYFKEKIEGLEPGKLLLPAEGEGRNAVFAAGMGWQVTAIDYSEQARIKAIKLAEQNNVRFEYLVMDMINTDIPEDYYNAAGLFYFHLTADEREKVHRKVMKSLKKGAFLILEAFHVRQLKNISGGPKSKEMLFTGEMLENDFRGLEFLEFEELKIELDQGLMHRGEAEIIRLFGVKK